eukprot:CAMPEP_0168618786 /NCGR_PEP_ID=MMETSP0449_2-20121227/6255_1 /TAXON_ID=1082188 /ORGANISM="Strombidium rassoulzadegani, Strain ras09" /LENGTH=270 /DNA_ID=CAMNT_0008659679 /DNA_START=35 /DNA_END=847 /DNA_ORIENTATION=+
MAQADKRRPYFESAVTLNPMYEKRYKKGEDNYVVRDQFICVTDGVGGWQRKMVDPGLFTKEYVSHIATLYDQKQYKSLKDLLDTASKLTVAKGSSTCVMAQLVEVRDPKGQDSLMTCNLGDSGYMWLVPKASPGQSGKAEAEIAFKSESQQHRFNAPFQTGTDKKWPTKAFSTSHRAQHNDIVVMGSDGIFDNLFPSDILSCMNDFIDPKTLNITDLQGTSNCLSTLAEIKGYDPKYESPFAIEAKAHGRKFRGGKSDDITVIVAQVKLD